MARRASASERRASTSSGAAVDRAAILLDRLARMLRHQGAAAAQEERAGGGAELVEAFRRGIGKDRRGGAGARQLLSWRALRRRGCDRRGRSSDAGDRRWAAPPTLVRRGRGRARRRRRRARRDPARRERRRRERATWRRPRAGDRLVGATEVEQRHAQTQPRHHQLGIDLERAAEPFDRDLVTPTLHFEQTREVGPAGDLGLERARVVVRGRGGIEESVGVVGAREIAPGLAQLLGVGVARAGRRHARRLHQLTQLRDLRAQLRAHGREVGMRDLDQLRRLRAGSGPSGPRCSRSRHDATAIESSATTIAQRAHHAPSPRRSAW